VSRGSGGGDGEDDAGMSDKFGVRDDMEDEDGDNTEDGGVEEMDDDGGGTVYGGVKGMDNGGDYTEDDGA